MREYLFGKAVSSPSLQTFATACWNRSPDRLMHKEWNLWYRVQAVLATQELSALTAADPAKTDIVYPGIGLAIARDGVFDLAVKAGNNGESHNHNDVGSFTLYKNGRPFIIDVGVETYTAKPSRRSAMTSGRCSRPFTICRLSAASCRSPGQSLQLQIL